MSGDPSTPIRQTSIDTRAAYRQRLHQIKALLSQVRYSEDWSSNFVVKSGKLVPQPEWLVALDALLLCLSSSGTDPTSNGARADGLEAMVPSWKDFSALREIGRGQFGSVQAARCHIDNKVYAIKTVEKIKAKRALSSLSLAFERHLHILATQQQTPPIPKLFMAFQTGEAFHLVTDFAARGTLADLLVSSCDPKGRGSTLEEHELAWWIPQMHAAVTWVHDAGFAHRDVKPDNFLVTDNARILLTDFGSCAPCDPGADISTEFCMTPAGTPDYIAPEILLLAEAVVKMTHDGQRTYRTTADWWSFGATLFEMATGCPPFWSPSLSETYAAITTLRPIQSSHGIAPGLSDYIQGLLSPEHNRNFTLPPYLLESSTSNRLPPLRLLDPIDLDDVTSVSEFMQEADFSWCEETTMEVTLNMERELDLSGIGWTWLPQPDVFTDGTATKAPASVKKNGYTPYSQRIGRRTQSSRQEMLGYIVRSATKAADSSREVFEDREVHSRLRDLDIEIKELESRLANLVDKYG